MRDLKESTERSAIFIQIFPMVKPYVTISNHIKLEQNQEIDKSAMCAQFCAILSLAWIPVSTIAVKIQIYSITTKMSLIVPFLVTHPTFTSLIISPFKFQSKLTDSSAHR